MTAPAASPLRVGFAGTPEFAASILSALLAGGYNVCVVYTQPDRKAGRGRRVLASPVKQFAAAQSWCCQNRRFFGFMFHGVNFLIGVA